VEREAIRCKPIEFPKEAEMATAKSHRELRVYQLAFESATKIHEITKSFPSEEKYSLTDQIRRSSRSVCKHRRSMEKKEVSEELREQINRL